MCKTACFQITSFTILGLECYCYTFLKFCYIKCSIIVHVYSPQIKHFSPRYENVGSSFKCTRECKYIFV